MAKMLDTPVTDGNFLSTNQHGGTG